MDALPVRTHLEGFDFLRDFQIPRRPVVLQGAASTWPALHDAGLDEAMRGMSPGPQEADETLLAGLGTPAAIPWKQVRVEAWPPRIDRLLANREITERSVEDALVGSIRGQVRLTLLGPVAGTVLLDPGDLVYMPGPWRAAWVPEEPALWMKLSWSSRRSASPLRGVLRAVSASSGRLPGAVRRRERDGR